MLGFTSISKRLFATLTLCMLSTALNAPSSFAAEAAADTGAASGGKTVQPEDDDFSNTPFTEYGEFNEEADEEADAKFFQHGRFFGVSLGLGYEGVTGNRGQLWQGGVPMVDFKLHYWFDFHVALDLGFYYAPHSYIVPGTGQTSVNMIHVGVDAKYYFDTKNLAAAISFANPYVLVGFGSFTKTENTFTQTSSTDTAGDPDTSIGLSLGAGLEFPIKPKKVYVEIEAKYHITRFKDNDLDTFESQGINDLSGGFYTLTANLLFTW